MLSTGLFGLETFLFLKKLSIEMRVKVGGREGEWKIDKERERDACFATKFKKFFSLFSMKISSNKKRFFAQTARKSFLFPLFLSSQRNKKKATVPDLRLWTCL